MKIFSKQVPRYLGIDDVWTCEEDSLDYKPDIQKRVWRAIDGGRERKFADKCIILKSIENKEAE